MSDLVAAAQKGTGKPKTARDLVEQYQPEFERALGDAVDPQHFVRSVLTVLTNNADLQKASGQSLIASVLLAAQLRLEVGGGLNQFHLTPRRVNERIRVNGEWQDNFVDVCVPIIGYQGYVELAYRNQKTLDFNKVRVYEADEFSETYSSERGKVYDWRPAKGSVAKGERGPLAGVLVATRTLGGGRIETFLTAEEIEARRPASSKEQTVKSGARKGEKYIPNTPWRSDYAAMADKTVVREHAKLLPKSVHLQRAVALDERVLIAQGQEVLALDAADDAPEAES